jgi:hypothetical protein
MVSAVLCVALLLAISVLLVEAVAGIVSRETGVLARSVLAASIIALFAGGCARVTPG